MARKVVPASTAARRSGRRALRKPVVPTIIAATSARPLAPAVVPSRVVRKLVVPKVAVLKPVAPKLVVPRDVGRKRLVRKVAAAK